DRIDRRHLRAVDHLYREARERRRVGPPDVEMPIHPGGDDLERVRIAVEVDEHRRSDDAALEAVEAVARRALREARLGTHREAGPSLTLAIPDVDPAGERRRDDLDASVAVDVRGGEAVADRFAHGRRH